MTETPEESDRRKLKAFLKYFIYADIALGALLAIFILLIRLTDVDLIGSVGLLLLEIFKIFIFITACIAFVYYKFYHKIESVSEAQEPATPSGLEIFIKKSIYVEIALVFVLIISFIIGTSSNSIVWARLSISKIYLSFNAI